MKKEFFYESPDCAMTHLGIETLLCQSGFADPSVDLGTKLDIVSGGEL